jgi:drug/metabolite transporter (DMT)-like permease
MVLSILSITAYNTLLYYTLLTTTAINAILINTARPVIVVLLSILFFYQGIMLQQSFGFLLVFIGTLTIIIKATLLRLSSLEFNEGDLWALAATFCWVLFTVSLRKRPSIHPTTLVTVTIFLGALILFPFYIWETLYLKPTPFVIETFGGVFYLEILATIAAYLFYNRVVEIADANKTGQVYYKFTDNRFYSRDSNS